MWAALASTVASAVKGMHDSAMKNNPAAKALESGGMGNVSVSGINIPEYPFNNNSGIGSSVDNGITATVGTNGEGVAQLLLLAGGAAVVYLIVR